MKLRKAGDFALNLFLSCLVGLLVLVWLGQSARNPWYRTYPVYTGSMSPAIQVGDLIVNTRPGALREGMVITFRGSSEPGSKERFITHRIVEISEDGLITTKGDANEDPDAGQITAAQVVGAYRLRVPYLGYLGAAVTPFRGLVMAYVGAAVVIAYEVRNIIITLRQERAKRRAPILANPGAVNPEAADAEEEEGPATQATQPLAQPTGEAAEVIEEAPMAVGDEAPGLFEPPVCAPSQERGPFLPLMAGAVLLALVMGVVIARCGRKEAAEEQ